MNAIDLTLDPSRMQIDTVWRLLRGTYWSPNIRREVVERAIAGSIVVGAFDTVTGEQVGFARAETDRATFAWLCDVIVTEEYRGRGIASEMVRTLMAHPDLQTLRRWCLATRDAHAVYSRLGFVPVPPNAWMECKLSPTAWADGHQPS